MRVDALAAAAQHGIAPGARRDWPRRGAIDAAAAPAGAAAIRHAGGGPAISQRRVPAPGSAAGKAGDEHAEVEGEARAAGPIAAAAATGAAAAVAPRAALLFPGTVAARLAAAVCRCACRAIGGTCQGVVQPAVPQPSAAGGAAPRLNRDAVLRQPVHGFGAYLQAGRPRHRPARRGGVSPLRAEAVLLCELCGAVCRGTCRSAPTCRALPPHARPPPPTHKARCCRRSGTLTCTSMGNSICTAPLRRSGPPGSRALPSSAAATSRPVGTTCARADSQTDNNQ